MGVSDHGHKLTEILKDLKVCDHGHQLSFSSKSRSSTTKIEFPAVSVAILQFWGSKISKLGLSGPETGKKYKKESHILKVCFGPLKLVRFSSLIPIWKAKEIGFLMVY